MWKNLVDENFPPEKKPAQFQTVSLRPGSSVRRVISYNVHITADAPLLPNLAWLKEYIRPWMIGAYHVSQRQFNTLCSGRTKECGTSVIAESPLGVSRPDRRPPRQSLTILSVHIIPLQQPEFGLLLVVAPPVSGSISCTRSFGEMVHTNVETYSGYDPKCFYSIATTLCCLT